MARGAAVQAAAVLTGRSFDDIHDAWDLGSPVVTVEPDTSIDGAAVRAAYARALLEVGPDDREVFRNPNASVAERVEDLLARMTLDEKLAQIGSIWLTELVQSDRFDADLVASKLEHGIGHVTRIGASTGLRPAASARLMNQIQQVAVERTRLGIPVMVHEEAVAGYCARDATQFPQAIGLASTWDEALVEEVADAIRAQMVAVGARHSLSPVLDVARDARWGRVEETYGEDPYLVGRIGTAYVRGLQGDDLRHGVIATGKHFLGYAMSEGGMNHAPVHLGPRELREVYAEPFAAAIRDAGLASIMNSYSSIDGLPCAGSRAILHDLLRGELGFDGVVVADYFAVELLISHHGVAADRGEAGCPRAGCRARPRAPGPSLLRRTARVEVGRTAPWPSRCSTTRSAVSCARSSRSACSTSRTSTRTQAAAVFDTPSDRTLARRAATQSIVLLKNEGDLLPLDVGHLRRVAVIGPTADEPRLLQGDYHYPTHIEIIYERQSMPGVEGPVPETTAAEGEQYLPADGGAFEPGPNFVRHVTPLEGLRAALPDVEVTYAQGCEVSGDDTSGIAEAAESAESSRRGRRVRRRPLRPDPSLHRR